LSVMKLKDGWKKAKKIKVDIDFSKKYDHSCASHSNNTISNTYNHITIR